LHIAISTLLPHPRQLTVRAEAMDGGVLSLVPVPVAAGARDASVGVALPAELRATGSADWSCATCPARRACACWTRAIVAAR
jgi:hypothetical protein